MTPKRHSSGLSVALRLVLMVCIQQILCSQAKTTRQTVPHMTQFITPIDAFKSHVHQTTEAVTPTETKENIKTRGVVDTATPPSITEVNAKDNHGKLFQTTEKITSSGNRIIHLLWSRKESETYTPSIFPAVTADEKETVAHTSDSPKRPLTEDPNELQKGTTIFNENRCIPTSGMDAVNGQNHCRESDNETVVAREMTNVSTPSLDEMTYSSLETPVSETTAVSEISNYLSMLPYLCPHANLCEKLTKKMSCCRTCSCAQDCGENCCFKNRTEAKHSEIVTECLPVQRELPGKFVSNYRTYNIVRKCRFPVIALFSMPGQLDNSWKTKLSPVFSNRTNMTYYNMDYAKCHAEYQADLVHWNRVEVCPSFSGQTYDKLHESILSRNCDTIYNPPSEYEDVIQECYHIDVNACNVTGDWDYYDQQIEQGCKSLNFPYTVEDVFNYHIKPKLFANAFCYLCNNKHGVKVSAHCTIGNIWNPDSFMTILSYTEENAIKPYTPEFSISGRNESECGVYQIPDTTKDSCIDILCPIGFYRGASGKCIQLISTFTETAIAMAFQLRSSDHGGWIDPLTETEMHDLSNALKTRMKQDQLEWCNPEQLLKYVNDVKSKPVNVLYSVNVRLHDMKADSFFDIIQNLIQVPIELQVNGQRRNISLELYHSALDEQDMSPIYKFSDNVAKIPKTQTKFKNDLHPHWITHCPPTYHTQLSKLSFCEQVILRAHEIIPENTEDGSRIFLISRNKYLYNFVVDFDKNVRICTDDFIELDKNADSRHPEDIKDKNEAQVNLTKGLSLLGLFLDALFLTSAIVATCLCHDLARQVKLQNLHLVISLELVQFLLWISMILSISGTTCTVVGFLIHFLSLSVQFIAGMSCKTTSSSASFTTRFSQFRRTILSVLKPHLLAAILVSINICFSVHYSTSGEIGYGSWMKMCFIADSFHRILTLLVPLGVTAASTAYPVLATIYERRKRLSPGNPGTPDKSECKQVYFGFCVLNLLTWLSEYYVMDTTKALYIFTVLNTIQCIFLAVCLIFICRRLGHQFTANEITLM